MVRLKRPKKIRIHHEGTEFLVSGGLLLLAINILLWWLCPVEWLRWPVLLVSAVVYGGLINFFRAPIRLFSETDTVGIVVAPADGKVVVIEETLETEYFGDRRLQVSIFMSLTNVHANWFPIDGVVRRVVHENGNFHRAFLPKASHENERASIVIDNDLVGEVLVRQIAGALARRIVTYAVEEEECYIDEHLGFIKLGSRVDIFLPLGTKLCVEMGQKVVGNQTVIARLNGSLRSNDK